VSQSSKYEISKLPEDHRLNIIRQAALFSDEETNALQKVGLIKNPNITFFTSLLDKDYKSVFRVFHSSRSPHCLQNQWQLLYKYDLLQGQRVSPTMTHRLCTHPRQVMTHRLNPREIVSRFR
jgi:hypothetical protein